jgi:Cys-tRNA(Pro)/Cys-tRNA(Cys) deacylase
MSKTNAVRELEAANIKFETFSWECPEAMSGPEVAKILGQDPDIVFKTLVTVGKSGEHYVYAVPVCMSLDLKKAAEAVGEKSIAMIKAKELLPLTGYVHGGCSPVGMKKQFKTVLDESAELYDFIIVSGGRLGYQIKISPADLARVIKLSYADITA